MKRQRGLGVHPGERVRVSWRGRKLVPNAAPGGTA